MSAPCPIAAEFFSAATESRALRMASFDGTRELEDRWLEEAYVAERDGNPRRAAWINSWAARLGVVRS